MPHYIHLAEAKSTNTYVAEQASHLPHGSVVYTYRQTQGRGQKGNSWESEPEKNLAFSFLLKNPGIAPSRQFYISEAVSIAVAEMLSKFVPDGIRIKWPNDIYFNDQKICGILIENTLCGNAIAHAIIGIGINVNQERFVSDAPNPVSLKNITGKDYDLDALLHDVNDRIEQLTRFTPGDEAALEALHHRYLSLLYRADGKAHRWQLPTGENFVGTIEDVLPDGLLLIRHEPTGEIGKYYFKEVKHVINQHIL